MNTTRAHNNTPSSYQREESQREDAQREAKEDRAHSSSRAIERRSKKSSSAFRTISEVADNLGVQQHVLRFWETKFTQVKPLKRGGGRRYYRPEDVAILERIHHLLYTEGYTIKGVQKLLKGQGKQQIISDPALKPANEEKPLERPAAAAPVSVQRAAVSESTAPARQGLTNKQRTILEAMLGDLKELRSMIKS